MSEETQTNSPSEAAPAPEANATATDTNAAPAEELTDEEELELLVDGKTIKEKINWKDRDGLRKKLKEEFQKAKAFNGKAQKAAEAEKSRNQIEADMHSLIEALKNDPMSVLQHEGVKVDVQKMFDAYIAKQIEEESKSPEQKEIEKRDAKIRQLEEQFEAEKKAKDEHEMAKMQTEVATKVNSDIMSALKSGNLPETPDAIARVARALKLANKMKVNVSAEEVIPFVKRQIYNESKALSSTISNKEIEEYLGQDRLKALIKEYNARNKDAKPAIPSASSIQPTGKELEQGIFATKKPTERVNPKLWLKSIEKTYGK